MVRDPYLPEPLHDCAMHGRREPVFLAGAIDKADLMRDVNTFYSSREQTEPVVRDDQIRPVAANIFFEQPVFCKDRVKNFGKLQQQPNHQHAFIPAIFDSVRR